MLIIGCNYHPAFQRRVNKWSESVMRETISSGERAGVTCITDIPLVKCYEGL